MVLLNLKSKNVFTTHLVYEEWSTHLLKHQGKHFIYEGEKARRLVSYGHIKAYSSFRFLCRVETNARLSYFYSTI